MKNNTEVRIFYSTILFNDYYEFRNRYQLKYPGRAMRVPVRFIKINVAEDIEVLTWDKNKAKTAEAVKLFLGDI